MLFSHKTQWDGWTCLCSIHSCIFSLIQELQEGQEGQEDQPEDAVLFEDPKREEKDSMLVSI